MSNHVFFYFLRYIQKIALHRDVLYTYSIGNHPYNMMVVFKMCDSVPSARYSNLVIYCVNGASPSSLLIIESVDSISMDERDAPLTQYITNAGITRARYTFTHFKHHHHVLWLIYNRMSV